MKQDQVSSSMELNHLLQMFLRGLRRFWLYGLLLTLLLAGLMGYRAWRSYVPSYTASATFTVYSTSALQSTSQTYNTATAEQMAKTFPQILTSGVLSQIIREDLGVSSLPSITAKAVDETNFLDLNVTGRDPQLCYDVLQSVIKNYPQVAELVVGPTVLELVDESGVPTQPTNVRSWDGAAKRGALIGAVLSIAAMMAYGYVKATVMDRSDMESGSNAKYLGGLPQLTQKRRSRATERSITILDSDSRSYREAFRLVTVRVEKYLRTHGNQTMLVTSAIPGEGKTTVAFNLAISLTQHNRKVILVDCDLRNPSVYKMTDQEPCAGLGDYLREKVKLREVAGRLIHKAEQEDMPDVLYAGAAGKTSPELLGSSRFADLMSMLRQNYDIVILDTPPCSMLADVSELAEQVDCALLVVRQNFASKTSVLGSLMTLSEYDIPVAGYVLNAFTGGIGSGYGYSYGYGYGYGYGKHYGKNYGRGYGSRYGEYGDYGSKEEKET